MKVIVANHSGFCFGVEKAIHTAFDEVNNNSNIKRDIYTLGPLIHNQQAVNKLESDGIKVIGHLDEVSDGTVIIRSHGVSKNIYDIAYEKKINLVDATCPFVRKIQNIVKEYKEKGYNIVIIGNPDHPEVVGINGWCNNEAYVVKTEDDIEKIPFLDKMCIVVQTTMSTSLYLKLTDMLEKKAIDVVKFNTICSATRDRQESARDLAKAVDVMIVVGGYHSSNTQKLVEICKEEKPNTTFHIETASELPINLLGRYETVGVTAGASTPKWIIDEVIEKINSL
ncbi:4-hydroxy-3-methylbut-2-enyl diphosphate reductase [Alkaliphilus sp. B6464]|uniref:4-hydroxy-3-methylbut-2-enyl diphosphate reductase n=1 Tax=Alkaliphilus sp. B6464 TaxID=2731219 RepID=UPI001BA5F1D5|nr:4-hydroxy-3-methylbut-2-enyl diphosphate reductase [Alkaliphilus sp. B6464]QUH20749.1 4-hydroxy-3-methylbut-2-enyl diphosphate reductase [Alkaliphilus sp. B6464]